MCVVSHPQLSMHGCVIRRPAVPSYPVFTHPLSFIRDITAPERLAEARDASSCVRRERAGGVLHAGRCVTCSTCSSARVTRVRSTERARTVEALAVMLLMVTLSVDTPAVAATLTAKVERKLASNTGSNSSAALTPGMVMTESTSVSSRTAGVLVGANVVGEWVVGDTVVGDAVGETVEGEAVGESVGETVGEAVEGDVVGDSVGETVVTVGAAEAGGGGDG